MQPTAAREARSPRRRPFAAKFGRLAAGALRMATSGRITLQHGRQSVAARKPAVDAMGGHHQHGARRPAWRWRPRRRRTSRCSATDTRSCGCSRGSWRAGASGRSSRRGRSASSGRYSLVRLAGLGVLLTLAHGAVAAQMTVWFQPYQPVAFYSFRQALANLWWALVLIDPLVAGLLIVGGRAFAAHRARAAARASRDRSSKPS